MNMMNEAGIRSRWMTVRLLVLVLSLAGIVSGCGEEDRATGEDGRVRVVTTTAMIADAARMVGGDQVRVTALMGPGTDPHLYTATAGDVTRMREADLILYNGLHLEGKMGEVLEGMERMKPVTAVGEAVPTNLRLKTGDSSVEDPHLWFDISRWLYVVGSVERALSEVDSAHARTYHTNAAAYRDSLLALDAWVREEVERVPESRRALITAHDAFAYFADAYGFEVHGLQGISTVSEAGTADIRRIAEMIADRGIPAIFVESSVPAQAIQAVQAAVESRGKSVRIGGELFSDAMGLEGTPEGTYLGMVRHNVNTIVSSLAGDEREHED